MILFCIIIGSIILHYAYLLSSLSNKIPTQISKPNLQDGKQHGISIIIPFRNEALRMEDAIKSLQELSYSPKCYEVIFINDHSSDNFSALVEKYEDNDKIRWIDNDGSGKKSAVESGVKRANFDWILSSDADCTFDPAWLECTNYLINNSESDLFVLPVYIACRKGLLNKFQYHDKNHT